MERSMERPGRRSTFEPHYVLDLDLSSHINLFHSRSNPIQVTCKFLDAIDNVIIKRPHETNCSKYVFKKANIAAMCSWE